MNRARMIAHRGGCRYEVENTIEAFIAAGNRSYFGIETDIVMTKDGKIVVFHDDDLKRLGNDERNIRDVTFDQLQEFDLKNHLTYLERPKRIVTFREYLKICKHYRKVPVIDVKWGFTETGLDQIMEEIHLENMENDSIIICYTIKNLVYLRSKYPNYPLQFLAGMAANEENFKFAIDNKLDLDIRIDLLTKELIDRFHANNLKVNVWCVDSEEDRLRFEEMGIDYITTNILEEKILL